MSGVLDGVDSSRYNGVWRLWKIGSLGLFAVFVGCAVDIAVSMRHHAGRTRASA